MLVYVNKEGWILLESTVEENLPPRVTSLRASEEAPVTWPSSEEDELEEEE